MKRAFTLTELLIAMAVIAVLAGILIPVIGVVRRQAKEVQCRNNLQQLFTGITGFRQDNSQAFPNGLRSLFEPTQSLAGESMKIAVCPFDGAKGTDPHMGRGTDGDWGDLSFLHEYDNTANSPTRGFASSYVFEASAQSINHPPITDFQYPWKFDNGEPWYLPGQRDTWWQAKAYQLRHGNQGGGAMPENRLPIIRCFHHYPWKTTPWPSGNNGRAFPVKVLNVAWDGTLWFSRPKWENDV